MTDEDKKQETVEKAEAAPAPSVVESSIETKTEDAKVEPVKEVAIEEKVSKTEIKEVNAEQVTVKETEAEKIPELSKEEYQELRKNVAAFGARKEWLFEVRSCISQEIKALFGELKELKERRDFLTSNVQTRKGDREKINTEIKDAIQAIRPAQKIDKKVNVEKVKQDLERLHYKVETTPMSPEEEKKAMKAIHECEKIIAKNSVASGSKEVSQQIETLKKQSNDIHSEVQDSAIESQEKHERMISVSRDIKYLKAREKEIHQLFTDVKENYKQQRKILMKNRKAHGGSSSGHPGAKRRDRAEKEAEIKKQMEATIEEKIKSGGKITTEDLLSFR
jgi:uncharacterized coiled-coil DUF342 family protein